jgi:hypothetical protein
MNHLFFYLFFIILMKQIKYNNLQGVYQNNLSVGD